jgi:hypothetical protein
MIAAGVVTVTLPIRGRRPGLLDVGGRSKVAANAPLNRAGRWQARIDARRLIAERSPERGLRRRGVTSFDRRRHPYAWWTVR